jgi:transglutaminase-like putative cysteine protease
VRGVCSIVIGLVLCGGPALGQERAPGKVILDLWDAAFVKNGRVGYTHITVRQVERDGKKLLRTTAALRLTVNRNGTQVRLGMDTRTDETPEGKVVGVFMRQYLGRDKQLTITGTVDGRQLRLVQDGTHPLKPAPWDERVTGLYGELKLFRQRKVRPGDAFHYWHFEPTINLVVRINVKVKGYEDVAAPGGRTRRLLRVESTPAMIERVQLPTLVTWLDEDLMPARSQVPVEGLGVLTFYRTTRAGALAPASGVPVADIGTGNYVRLRRPIANPYGTRSMVYRVTVKGDQDPASTFSRDERQEVKNVRGNTFDLYVRASRPPRPGAAGREGGGPGAEFLQSSYFITSADPKVRELARRAVGTETDPWRKALWIERWVCDHMTVVDDEALATADHVARTLRGDCTEYAMLMAAMCRAAGVPSKTALGLIYADTRLTKGPVFAFHMWTEVWVAGRWVPLDATLGRGYVGATHLKVTDASWQDTRSMTPLLPVLRVLGKLSVEPLGPAGG